MKYEMLVRRVWDNCGRYGDPLGIANADVYDNNILDQGNRLKFGVSYAIQKALHEFDIDNFPDEYNRLHELEDNVWEVTDQQGINSIIEESHKILDRVAGID